MVKKTTENFAVELVPLDDVARALGAAPEHIRQLAGDEVSERWDGSLAIPGEVARKIRLNRESEARKDMELRAEHQAYLTDRQARRQALMLKIREDLVGSGVVTPASSARVREAQHEALQRFDEHNPELDYYRWCDARPTMAAAR